MKRLTLVLMSLTVSMGMLADKHELDFLKEAVRVASTPDSLLVMPEWMHTDALCFDYCMSMPYQKEEKYRADVELVERRWKQCEKLWDAFMVLENNPKLVKKLKVSDEAMAVMSQTHEDLHNPSIHERFSVMCRYCDNYWKMRHEADQCEMPGGRLLYLEYEEHGSSRPIPVYAKIEPDSTGQMMVSVANTERPWTGEMLKAPASDELLAQIRSMIEEKKLYKMIRYSSLPGGFRNYPLPTGGPPSWSFSAQFEEGRFSSSNDGWDRFGFADELMQMLTSYVVDTQLAIEEAADAAHVSLYKQWWYDDNSEELVQLSANNRWTVVRRVDDDRYDVMADMAIELKAKSPTAGTIFLEDGQRYRYRNLTKTSMILVNEDGETWTLKTKPHRVRIHRYGY